MPVAPQSLYNQVWEWDGI